MARLGGASNAAPLGKKGEQDMGDEGWLSRHGLYPWFLVISGVCLVVNLVDGMVLMSHGPSVGIGVLLVVCVVADLWMAVRPRIGCWAVFLVLLAGTLSPVPFPASYLLSCLAAAGFLGYLGIKLGVAACVPGVLYAVLLAVLHHQEYRPGQGTPLSFALLCVIAALAGISLRLTRQRDTERIRRAAAGRNAQTARRLHDYTTNDLCSIIMMTDRLEHGEVGVGQAGGQIRDLATSALETHPYGHPNAGIIASRRRGAQ